MLKSKLLEKYETEINKQTDPYSFYLLNSEEEIKGVHDCDPFICIEEIDDHRVYDCGEYLLYESVKGVSSDVERQELIEEARKLNADIIYSDTDHITCDGKRHTPFYKPDWSPETYESFRYFDEFYAVKKENNGMDITKGNRIAHVTKTLFHCISNDNAQEIYSSYVKEYKTPDYESQRVREDEIISVIIPSKDNPELIKQCFEGLNKAKIKSGINQIDTVLVDNGSSEDNKNKITHIIDKYEDLNITYLYEPEEFNFSAMCNKGVGVSKGKYLLFLNDDIEVLDEMFLVKLLHYARRPHVGAVSSKLLYPGGDLIQHSGVTDLMCCGPTHKLSTHSDAENMYFGINKINRNTLAVTGACLMVSREKYFMINGFCDKMKVGYNDIDLCVSLYEKGFYNVIVNDAVLFHHESVSRGSDTVSDEKYLRLREERDLLYERHPFLREKGDPFYNANLIDDSLDYRVNIICDFESRSYRSMLHTELQSKAVKLRRKSSKKAFCNIESVNSFRQIFDEGDYVSIDGWAVLNKKDNALFNRYLCIFDGENAKVYEMASKYREDVGNVFPDAENALLAGFNVKIPATELEKDKEYEYGVLFVSRISGIKYYAGFIKSDS